MKYKLLIMLLAFSIFVSSCYQNGDLEGSSVSPTDSITPDDTVDTLGAEDNSIENKCRTKYFIEESSENIISVGYPVFDGDNSVALNALIRNEIYTKINEMCYTGCTLQDSDVMLDVEYGEEYSEFYINIDYYITYESEELLSIVFSGMLMHRLAAHPIHQFFTLNIDPVKCEQIKFSDRYILNEELYLIFSAKAKEHFVDTTLSDIDFSKNICSKDDFMNGMLVEDAFYSYYTDSGVGFSYPVEFALGNHLEVEISNDTMEPFKR